MADWNDKTGMLKEKLGWLVSNMRFTSIIIGVLVLFVIITLAGMMVNIPSGQVGVVTQKMGETLPEGMVIAPDDSYQGIQKEVLKTGWHLINPLTTDVELSSAQVVPQGKKGLINLKAGKNPNNPDDILVEDGERGYQKKLLEPGTHFLNPEIVSFDLVDPIVIPPLHVGIVTSQVGKPSQEDIVPKGFKGVWKEVLKPGTYWLNPKGYQVRVEPAIEVPNGHVGVVLSRTGKASKKDLVDRGEKGIQREVLKPGTYYINTKAEEITVVRAVHMEAGYVGVVVLKTGKEPEEPTAIIVKRGERGVQPYTLPAGLHYLNPFEFRVLPVDSRVQKYEMSGKDTTLAAGEISGDDGLVFPSADGFSIKVDSSIEWQIETERLPEVVASIGNTQEIIDKIIRPNAREIGRLEGSKLKAEDFIKGEKREQFVTRLEQTLKQRCALRGILIHKALVREVHPPEAVAKPLKDRELALLMQATNKEMQKQARSEAELAEAHALIEQKKQKIQAETAKVVAETEAQRKKEVAKIMAEQLREVARVEQEQQLLILEKQKLEAKGIRELADAEAHRASELVKADGALDKKLKAWSMVMRSWATNENLVPRVVVGGGGKDGSLTGQELILELMAIDHLDRFTKGQEKGKK